MTEDQASFTSAENPKGQEYYRLTAGHSPRPLLIKAVSHLDRIGEALDLGCGAGMDTRFLLDRGFRVTAMDGNPLTAQYLAPLASERLTYITSHFADFNYQSYDLISAQYSLPFNPKDGFTAMFARVKAALKPGGLFTGNLFGVNDSRNTPTSRMTFHARPEAEALLAGLEVVEFDEREEDSTLANGTPNHWHTFEIIARRPGP